MSRLLVGSALLGVCAAFPASVAAQVYDPLGQTTYVDPELLHQAFAIKGHSRFTTGFATIAGTSNYGAVGLHHSTDGPGAAVGGATYWPVGSRLAEADVDGTIVSATTKLNASYRRVRAAFGLYEQQSADSDYSRARWRALLVDEQRSRGPQMPGAGVDVTGRIQSQSEEVHAGVTYYPGHGSLGVFDWIAQGERVSRSSAVYLGMQLTAAWKQTKYRPTVPQANVDSLEIPFADYSIGLNALYEWQPTSGPNRRNFRVSGAFLPMYVGGRGGHFRYTFLIRITGASASFSGRPPGDSLGVDHRQ